MCYCKSAKELLDSVQEVLDKFHFSYKPDEQRELLGVIVERLHRAIYLIHFGPGPDGDD